MNKLKLLLAVLMSTLVVFASQRTYIAKSEAIGGIYSDLFFTRLAVETQQYTRQIEYGLENGKSLENFYNIQTILSNVRRCSSYINGAYIVSESMVLMYSLSDAEASELTRISVPSAHSIYSVYDTAGEYLISLPISGRSGENAGYMVLSVSRNAVSNSVSDFNQESFIQSAVMCGLAILLGYVLIINRCRRRESIYFDCTRITAVTICSEILLDSVISMLKLQMTLDSLIQQSVSKIVMALQNDLDAVAEKGIAVSRIYDLNSWLLESCRQIPFIDNLIYDKNYKISAIVVPDYAVGQAMEFLLLLAGILGICAAAGALLCFGGLLADKRKNRAYLTKEVKGEKLNADDPKKPVVSA